MITTKPLLTKERIDEINAVIAENPTMGRTQISVEICRRWDWRSPNGQWKDISSRDMLRALDQVGKIKLPPAAKAPSRKTGYKIAVKHLEHSIIAVEWPLAKLLPIRMESVGSGAELGEFKSYIDQFHYLGFDRTVGENMKYMARGQAGEPLACMLFGSAAWSCSDRDHFIGWDKTQKTRNLQMITNQTRFLIFPWVRVPHLASHLLSLVSKRISGDWEEKYGHSIVALETFVEAERFQGTCYKAANWIKLGTTTGRGRDGGHHHAILPIKDIYIHPLAADFRETLCR